MEMKHMQFTGHMERRRVAHRHVTAFASPTPRRLCVSGQSDPCVVVHSASPPKERRAQRLSPHTALSSAEPPQPAVIGAQAGAGSLGQAVTAAQGPEIPGPEILGPASAGSRARRVSRQRRVSAPAGAGAGWRAGL